MTPCGRHANVFRFMPPLTIPREYAVKAIGHHARHPQGVLSRRESPKRLQCTAGARAGSQSEATRRGRFVVPGRRRRGPPLELPQVGRPVKGRSPGVVRHAVGAGAVGASRRRAPALLARPGRARVLTPAPFRVRGLPPAMLCGTFQPYPLHYWDAEY